jgi:hypothetical protein
MYLFKKDFHVLAIGFREAGAAILTVRNIGSGSLFGLFDQPTFKIPDVSFGQVLVLAREEDDLVPKVFAEVIFQSVTNGFRLADIYGALAGFRIDPSKKIDARLLGFFAGDDVFELAPRPSYGLTVSNWIALLFGGALDLRAPRRS